MRYQFPIKRKKKNIPLGGMLVFFTCCMVLLTIFGENGLLHALTIRMHKDMVLQQVEQKQQQNEHLRFVLRNMVMYPEQAKKLISEQYLIAEDNTTVYRFIQNQHNMDVDIFKSVDDITWANSMEFLQSWVQGQDVDPSTL